MINELVTNALKHGFGADLHGKVSIELVNSGDDLLILSVGNNGQELAPDIEFIRLVKSVAKSRSSSIPSFTATY